jgi:hypothetical protein
MANIPEYMRVRQYVVDLVMSHPNADKRIMSERELCRKLDVARITARRALKGLIDDGWLYVKPGKGMFIHSGKCRNNAFAMCKFYKLMLIWGDGKNIHIDGFFMDLMERLCAGLKRLPVWLQSINLIGENGKVIDELSIYRPDGIIWMRPTQKMTPVIAAMRKKIPVCVVGNMPSNDKFAVTMDYHAAGRLLAGWFLKRKCRRTAFVGQMPESEITSAVLTCWLDEFADRKIPFDRNLIVYENENIGRRAEKLLNNGLDGVFSFASDFLALDDALAGKGKDFPVVIDENYYGYYLAKTQPTAKLILFPPEIMAAVATGMFRRLSEPSYRTSEIVFKPEII